MVVKPAVGVVAVVDSAATVERGRRREDRCCWSRSCRRGDTIPHVPSCLRKVPSLPSLQVQPQKVSTNATAFRFSEILRTFRGVQTQKHFQNTFTCRMLNKSAFNFGTVIVELNIFHEHKLYKTCITNKGWQGKRSILLY